MTQISASLVKDLREKTGAGMMDCKKALIETGGETDVMMRLFGPNSRTNVLAENDDGGVGLNAKIVARLIPGEYLVQVRHYNRRNGVGDYTIVAR